MITALAARDLFWFAAGLMSALAALFVIVPLLPRIASSARQSIRAMRWPAIAMIAMGSAALALYLWQGSPNQPSIHGTAGGERSDTRIAANPTSARRAASIEAVLAQLEQRLRQRGGSAADWELLAQTYDFLGRGSDAQQARGQHRVAAAAELDTTVAPSAPAAASAAANAATESLLTQAGRAREAGDYAAAIKAYEQLAKLGAMSADSWADYADAAASINGGQLAGAPERLIAAALAQDPNNDKALWLLASLQHERRQYPQAVASWRHLLQQAPAGSSDARIFAANLAEDQGLAGTPESSAGAQADATALPTAGANPAVLGRVELADALRSQVTPGLTVFIVAKSLDSPGPPVAVLRSAAGEWPLSFRLDDSLAMVPGRSLSTAGRVSVQARVSRTGLAMPAPGDLQSAVLTVDPRQTQPVRLVIDQAVR